MHHNNILTPEEIKRRDSMPPEELERIWKENIEYIKNSDLFDDIREIKKDLEERKAFYYEKKMSDEDWAQFFKQLGKKDKGVDLVAAAGLDREKINKRFEQLKELEKQQNNDKKEYSEEEQTELLGDTIDNQV